MQYLDRQQLQLFSTLLQDVVPIFFYGEEEICKPFIFYVVIGIKNRKSLVLGKLLRTFVKIQLSLDGKKRFFNGSVREVEELSYNQVRCGDFLNGTGINYNPSILNFLEDDFLKEDLFYRLTLVPDFWFLSETQDSRIFQNMTIVGILQKILKENSLQFTDQITDFEKKQNEFCVQYNESTFNFVCRLMEQEGYNYFFDHSEHFCRLVLSNGSPVSLGSLKFKGHIIGDKPPFYVYEMLRSELSVNENVILKDFNFEKPDQGLLVKKTNSDHQRKQEVMFSYPGGFSTLSEGQNVAERLLKAQESKKHRIKAQTTHPSLTPGKKFRLENHPDTVFNKAEFLILKVQHFWSRQGNYINHALLLPAARIYVPEITLSKPKIYGIQTAIVAGKPSEDIWTEKYGRIKVKFHWDRRQEIDERSSCWIRVASPLAGNDWGVVATPRLGQEVIVVFINGNPDEPVVMGCVYNGLHHPPYAVKEPAKTTFKTRTLKGQTSNEVTFDDTKDKEEIFVHAQRNYRTLVENSAELQVMKGSLKQVIARGDRNITLEGAAEPSEGGGDDRLTLTRGSQIIDLQAKGNKPGNLTTTLAKGTLATTLKKGDHTLLLQEGQATTTLKKGNYAVILNKGNSELTLKDGDRTVKVGGDDSLSVTKGDLTIKITKGTISIKAGKNAVYAANGCLDLKAKKITVKADALLELKAGVIKIKSGGLLEAAATGITTIKGALVKLN